MAINLWEECNGLREAWHKVRYEIEGGEMTKADKLREEVSGFQDPVPKGLKTKEWMRVISSALEGITAMEQMMVKSMYVHMGHRIIQLQGVKGNVTVSMYVKPKS